MTSLVTVHRSGSHLLEEPDQLVDLGLSVLLIGARQSGLTQV